MATRRNGSILRAGPGRWKIKKVIGYKEDGRPLTFVKTVIGTKAEAEALLAEVSAQKSPVEASILVGHFLDRWVESVAKARVRQRTYTSYKYVVTQYLKPQLGSLRLSRVGMADVQNLVAKLQEHDMAPASIRRIHAVLRSAFNEAVKWRLIPRNPATGVTLPRMQRMEHPVLSRGVIQALLGTAKETPWYVLFAFAVATGMRPGEYLALRWTDLDLTAGTATVRRALIEYRGGGYGFEEPKTKTARRTVTLPPSLVDLLKERQKRIHLDSELVFPARGGGPLEEHNLYTRVFKPLVTKAGLDKRLRLYDLRHASATLLLEAGESPKVTSERLGHASVAFTQDVYQEVLPTMQVRSANLLESAVFSSPPRASRSRKGRELLKRARMSRNVRRGSRDEMADLEPKSDHEES